MPIIPGPVLKKKPESHSSSEFQDLFFVSHIQVISTGTDPKHDGETFGCRAASVMQTCFAKRGGEKNEWHGHGVREYLSTPALSSFNTFTHSLEHVSFLVVFCQTICYRFAEGYGRKINFSLPRHQSLPLLNASQVYGVR